jgi:hypothetical protein
VTVRDSTATVAVSLLVLFIQSSASAPLKYRPADEVVQPGPARPSAPSTVDTGGRGPRSEPSPPGAEAPLPPPRLPRPETPRPPAPSSTAVPQASPTLDLTSLEKRLRETSAIGVFTKLSLKNQVEDLLEQFAAFHQGRDTTSLRALRESYDLLLLKVLSLLQDKDPALAGDIAASREALWNLLTDPAKFAHI